MNKDFLIERNLFITILMNVIITVTEIIGGVISGSLSLISDSFHNLSDTMAGVLSLFAVKLSHKSSNEKFTFGYRRAEILVAIGNSMFLLIITIFIFREAILKLANPSLIRVSIMLPVALIGLIANFISTFLLHRYREDTLNIKSAYLHLLTDTLSSVVVVVGALLMLYFKIYWIDSILSMGISIFIAYESIKVLWETTGILMECKPSWVDLEELKKDIESLPEVKNIHHVHVWRLSDKSTIFEGHINVEDIPVSKTKELRTNIERILEDKYRINHTTIQFEYEEHKEQGLIKEGNRSKQK